MLTAAIVVSLLFLFVIMYFIFGKTKKLDDTKDFELVSEDVYTNNLVESIDSNKTEEAKIVAEVIELGEEILRKLEQEEPVKVPKVAKKKTAAKKKTSKKKSSKSKTTKTK